MVEWRLVSFARAIRQTAKIGRDYIRLIIPAGCGGRESEKV